MTSYLRETYTRNGVSLLELLVVICVIGTLAAVLLPAVQKAREAANRVRCQNNLRQVGLAALSYESEAGKYPPAATTATAKTPLPKANHGWAVFVLPHFEEGALVAGYDWTRNWNDRGGPNVDIARKRVRVLLCPSSPAPPTVSARGVTDAMFVGDYRPVARVSASGASNLAGPGGFLSTADPKVALKPPMNDGVMRTNTRTTVAAVADGTSNTLLLVEGAGASQLYRGRAMFDPRPLQGAAWADRHALVVPAGYDPDEETVTDLSAGATQPGQVAVNGTNNNEVYAFHPGGANAVFADGHVRFLRDTLPAQALVALVTYRAGDLQEYE